MTLGSLVLDLGRLMASSCRQRILIAVSKVGQPHVTDLVRRVNSTYSQVNRNLQILEHEGIVTTQYYDRLRIIKLNRENPKTVTLLEVLRQLRDQSSRASWLVPAFLWLLTWLVSRCPSASSSLKTSKPTSFKSYLLYPVDASRTGLVTPRLPASLKPFDRKNSLKIRFNIIILSRMLRISVSERAH